MSTRLSFFVLLALVLSPAATWADFQLVTDENTLNPNDQVLWQRGIPPMRILDPLVSAGGVSVQWSAFLQATPPGNVFEGLVPLTPTFERGLNLAAGIEFATQPATASADFNLFFAATGLPVFATGFNFGYSVLPPNTLLTFTATDVDGHLQTFDLPFSGIGTGFIGIVSDVPLAHLEILESHTGISGGVGFTVGSIDLTVAPAPPAWGLLLSALPLLLFFRRRVIAA